tara:strand:- start:9303 stop:9536 length:234 start_codon:yes stop_codon:yes gene_type:complete
MTKTETLGRYAGVVAYHVYYSWNPAGYYNPMSSRAIDSFLDWIDPDGKTDELVARIFENPFSRAYHNYLDDKIVNQI